VKPRVLIGILASLLMLPVATHAATRTVVLSVPTMDCATCPLLIRTALERVSGVSKAKVSYERREAVVTFDDSRASVTQLVEATTQVGYPSFTR
jgi:mercuric ion binding protein